MKDKIKTKGSDIKKTTSFRFKKYLLLIEALLLTASAVLAGYTAYKLNIPVYAQAFGYTASAYAFLEGLAKLNKAVE